MCIFEGGVNMGALKAIAIFCLYACSAKAVLAQVNEEQPNLIACLETVEATFATLAPGVTYWSELNGACIDATLDVCNWHSAGTEGCLTLQNDTSRAYIAQLAAQLPPSISGEFSERYSVFTARMLTEYEDFVSGEPACPRRLQDRPAMCDFLRLDGIVSSAAHASQLIRMSEE